MFSEANLRSDQLDAYAYASRKLPEYMHHRLVACPGCDLLYANPAPEQAALADAYQAADFDSQEEARCASSTYGRLVRGLGLRQRDGALDIGTGEGSFLEQLLELGFTNVRGIEPSDAPIAAAAPAIRPLIIRDVFRPADFPPASLSLVTCFQTIEHVPDPLGLCRASFELLKPGGALFIICHNRRAFSARVLGRKSPIFDLEHLQLFSPRSAELLLERAGFGGIRVRPILNRYPLHYWAKLFPLPPAAKLRLLGRLRASRGGSVPIALPAGNLAVVGFKP
ncbi:MAG TPA: class I SAM-dependent methyltransferase [Herpetosiphonaceae bacterium]